MGEILAPEELEDIKHTGINAPKPLENQGDYIGVDPVTGVFFVDDTINQRARRRGIVDRRRRDGGDYELFDRAGFIEACFNEGRPVAITWVPSYIKLRCRNYEDVFGIPDIVGIEEIHTMFTGVKGMEKHRIFLIPYLITGYDIPNELEQDPERLVPFTAKDIEMIKEIESGNN